MPTLILYGTTKAKRRTGYYAVLYPTRHRPGAWIDSYYVRAEETDDGLETALANAKPRPGEVVLNTVTVENRDAQPA